MEYDVRGGVVALDAETGSKAWTFWTAAGDPSKPFESKTMEAVAKTWDGESWKLGGANVWDTITYDAATNLLLIGTSTTGEPVGDFADIKSSGSRLFANCIVAVNASTGAYVWHYQTATPPSGAEEFHILVNISFAPTLTISLLDPSAVLICAPITFVAEGLRLFLKLLACVYDHHPAVMRDRRLLTLNEETIKADARRYRERIIRSLGTKSSPAN